MNRKNNGRKLIWISIFIMLVSISGAALAASGNLENPLAALIGGRAGGPPAGMDAGRPERRQGATPTETQEQRFPEGGRGGEGGDQANFNWSAIGSVLNNVWFLFAITGVVMLIQIVWDSVKQLFKRREPEPASAS